MGKKPETKIDKIDEKIETSTSKKISLKDGKEKIYIPIWKVISHLWFFYRTFKKSKKMARVMKDDPNRYTEEYRYTWVNKKVNKLLKIANIKINVFGIENWVDEGLVLVPNHKSNFDPLILLAINDFNVQQVVGFIAKIELWHSKMGRFASIIDAVPLDRNNPRSALTAFNAAKNLIVNYKRAMTIFPEGTRHIDDEIHEFNETSMKLPQMANSKVVPVSIIGTNKLSLKTSKTRNVTVVFGKPIDNKRVLAMKTDVLSNIVYNNVRDNYIKYKDIEFEGDNKVSPVRKQKRRKIYYYDSI